MGKAGRWTKEDEQYMLKIAKNGELFSIIGNKMGRKVGGIRVRLTALGYGQGDWTDEQRNELGIARRITDFSLTPYKTAKIKKDIKAKMPVVTLMRKYKISHRTLEKIRISLKRPVKTVEVMSKIDREFLKDIPIESGVVYRFKTKNDGNYKLEPVTCCRRLTVIKNALFFKNIVKWRSVQIIKITGKKQEVVLTITAEQLKFDTEFRDFFKLGVKL